MLRGYCMLGGVHGIITAAFKSRFLFSFPHRSSNRLRETINLDQVPRASKGPSWPLGSDLPTAQAHALPISACLT